MGSQCVGEPARCGGSLRCSDWRRLADLYPCGEASYKAASPPGRSNWRGNPLLYETLRERVASRREDRANSLQTLIYLHLTT
jgi:hypothetical protein